jgi:uncharacterized protein (DUF58 family)
MIGLPLRERIADWISRPRFPESGSVRLTQRRVYVLPTRAGLGFGVVLLLSLTGSINYTLSLGFALTFLLSGMAVVSILHTYRNLAQLRISPGRCTAVFVGDIARLPVLLDNPSNFARISIGLRQPDGSISFCDAAPGVCSQINLLAAAERRGYLRPGRFSLFTNYPVGLTHAWSNFDFNWSCIVYPAPEPCAVAPPVAAEQAADALPSCAGEEDFAGLRNYQPGDSPRRIAWKSSARSDLILTKQFGGGQGDEIWLDWEATQSLQDVEMRISRLTRWVLDADAMQVRFGLRLPHLRIDPGSGGEQRDHCLRALALFEAAS